MKVLNRIFIALILAMTLLICERTSYANSKPTIEQSVSDNWKQTMYRSCGKW